MSKKDPCRGFIFQLILVYAQTVFNSHTSAPKFSGAQTKMDTATVAKNNININVKNIT